jgi:hypothetical protein
MKTMLFIFAAGAAVSVCASNEPHIGFAFPAGGQCGTSIEMQIGGQYFSSATNVFVSGEGVSVDIKRFSVKYDAQRVGQFFRNIENNTASRDQEAITDEQRATYQRKIDQTRKQLALIDLPDGMDPFDKKAVQRYVRADKKEQFNPQIADRLRVTMHVARNAPPGERELRVYTPAGLSNPVYFEVGTLAEALEEEPNDDHMMPGLLEVPVPAVINGQVRPGDIDHFRFKANKGDSIVVDVAARRIIPYLADAVPGWFQAVVAIYDEDGNEVAYQDDYKFNPDPVLFFDVPETGTYTLSIRDSIYRGREDFIYRIAIGELPFITSIFPLGAQHGKEVDIALGGRNLPRTRLTGTLPENGYEVRHVSVKKNGYQSNEMPFAIGEMNEVFEVEPNNSAEKPQAIRRPLVINGRIQQPGDVDVFAFDGHAGDSVSIEVMARRLNSPLDSVITLKGPGLEQPVRNDDYMAKLEQLHLGAGLVTHHADSYLLHELPADGRYTVEIGDAQSQGGHDYGYRLRISESNPDFQLRMEPSGINIAPGGTAAFSVRALRLDGFDKQIKLEAANLPEGFAMSTAIIPKGSDMTRFTITAPRQIEGKVISPEITGTGMINGKAVTHHAVPVDNQMQAFLYRHLVPAKELVLAPVSQRPPLAFEARIPKAGVIELPAGRETRISFNGRVSGPNKGYSIKLDNPPEGFSAVKNGWIGRTNNKDKKKDGKPFDKNMAAGQIVLKVDESVAPGTRASLVVAAEVRKGKETTYYPAPAIPIKVVKAE